MSIEYSDKLYAQLVEVNDKVNRAMTYKTDQENYQVPELWVMPEPDADGNINIPAFGDCDDFACCKYAMLLQAGVPDSAMGIASCMTKSGLHAVLLVETSAATFVLDNICKAVISTKKTGYEWKYVPRTISEV